MSSSRKQMAMWSDNPQAPLASEERRQISMGDVGKYNRVSRTLSSSFRLAQGLPDGSEYRREYETHLPSHLIRPGQ